MKNKSNPLPLAKELKSDSLTHFLSLVSDKGEERFADELFRRFADGVHPVDIAKELDVPWLMLRRWIELDSKRMDGFALAKRCYADHLAYDSLQTVREASTENVQVAKLQSDAYVRMAGKLSRVEWGEDKAASTGFASGGITITINRIGAPVEVDDAVIVDGAAL